MKDAYKGMASYYSNKIKELEEKYQGVRPSWVSAELGSLISSRDYYLSLMDDTDNNQLGKD